MADVYKSCLLNSDIGGEWHLTKTDFCWQLIKPQTSYTPAAIISLYPDTAWKLFSKGISPKQALDKVEIIGDRQLGAVA